MNLRKLTRHPFVIGIAGAVLAAAVLFFGQALVSAQIGPGATEPWAPPYLGDHPQFNYQGRLVDPDTGEDMPDGTYSMTFQIYTDANATSGAWDETKTVTVSDGLFSTMLGDTNSIDPELFDGTGYLDDPSGGVSDLWLGIAVDGDAEMTPRQQLGYVPRAAYALNADRLSGVPATEFVTASSAARTFAVDLAVGESQVIVENGPLSYTFSCTVGEARIMYSYSSTGGRYMDNAFLSPIGGYVAGNNTTSGAFRGGQYMTRISRAFGLMHTDGSGIALEPDSLMLAFNWPQAGRCRASGIYYVFP